MDVNEFRTEILEEIHLNAMMNGTSPREEFLAMYTEALIDAEEFEDFEQVPYEGVGSQNRRIQIDGYCYNELDDCLDIAVCPFRDSTEAESLTATEADAWFRRARAFAENAQSGFLQKNAEESSPGYGLAVDIQNRYKNVTRFRFFIMTDMIMSNRIREIPATHIGQATAEYHIWDIARLQELMSSKTGKEDIVIDLKQFSDEGIPCLPAGETEEYTAYLCSIPGKILAELYNRYGGRLLEGNVRSFLSVKGKINKGIRNTILNEPSMFFAYNNGIAATAYNVEIERRESASWITGITALQIVNGGQTTASLAAALTNDRSRANDLRDVYVPMKLSVVSPEKAMELIPNIARYANKQNKVSDADFFSNHAFHVRMEDLSRRILAPAVKGNQFGTCWYYERTRGQYKQQQARMSAAEKKRFLARNPKPQMFTKTDLAKFYNTWRQLPWQVCSGAQKNFMRFAEWASSEWDKHESSFNEDFFKKVVGLDILYRSTDRIVKNAPWYEMGYKAQVVTYTIAELFKLIEKEADRTFDFRTLWNRQEISHATELQLEELAEAMYNHLISPDRGVQNVTEWAKREACWSEAKKLHLNLREDFKQELIWKTEQKNRESDARSIQKQLNQASAMIKVAEYGADGWKKVLAWGLDAKIFTPMEISLLKTAVEMENSKFPSERQCARILQILEKARMESYPG